MSFIGYKMTHDTGFAPNPFGGCLTLATCKPTIRRTKRPGDRIAGFASQSLVHASGRAGVTIPQSGLLYLMRVGEVLRLEDYFRHPRFQCKKPVLRAADPVQGCGDNIYDVDATGRYMQLPNDSHDDSSETIDRDTKGVNVLVGDIAYYFGRNCPVPEGGWDEVGVALSKGRTFYCSEADLHNIFAFLSRRGYEPGVHGKPCMWQDPGNSAPMRSTCSTSKPHEVIRREPTVPPCRR